MTGAPMGLGGTRLIGTGSATPDGILTNADLEKILDTSDEWIQQRTGIKQRRVVDQTKGESTVSICCDALEDAIKNTGVDPDDIDLIICATCTQQMSCPSVACRAAERIGATRAAAFDLAAACSGFVYALNTAEYCAETAGQLGDIVRGKVDATYRERVDLEPVCDCFHDACLAACVCGSRRRRGIV